MTISGTLIAAGTATTNPAPNGLGTPAPATFAHGVYTPSAAWLTQSATYSPALFPNDIRDGSGTKHIELEFVPSVAGATYTATIWQWNRLASTWVQPKDNASFSLTGSASTYLEDPGLDPWFIQLSSISSGTVAIYFDNGLARAQ
jgi:hypothetical protein